MLITGYVYGPDGSGLPSAHVVQTTEDGTAVTPTNATTTTEQGFYAITVPTGSYLTASYTGYDEQTELVEPMENEMDFQLGEKQLDTVTVTGKATYWKEALAAILILAAIIWIWRLWTKKQK